MDYPGGFKHCLASASKCSDLTALGTTWATGLYLKLPRWRQRAAKSRNEWVRVKIRISQDAFVYEITPHTSFLSLSKGVCVWERKRHSDREADRPTDCVLRAGRKGGIHVCVQRHTSWKSCISDSNKAHLPQMKTNPIVFFKIIPKSQFALLIFSVNLYFINNECEWSFLKLNEKKIYCISKH